MRKRLMNFKLTNKQMEFGKEVNVHTEFEFSVPNFREVERKLCPDNLVEVMHNAVFPDRASAMYFYQVPFIGGSSFFTYYMLSAF